MCQASDIFQGYLCILYRGGRRNLRKDPHTPVHIGKSLPDVTEWSLSSVSGPWDTLLRSFDYLARLMKGTDGTGFLYKRDGSLIKAWCRSVLVLTVLTMASFEQCRTMGQVRHHGEETSGKTAPFTHSPHTRRPPFLPSCICLCVACCWSLSNNYMYFSLVGSGRRVAASAEALPFVSLVHSLVYAQTLIMATCLAACGL